MNDDLKLALVVISIMLVFIFIGTVAISIKLDLMEGDAKDRYLNTVIAVGINRDRVEALKEEDLLFIQTQLDTILFDQRELWVNVIEKLTIIKELTTPLTFDEMMDLSMEEMGNFLMGEE